MGAHAERPYAVTFERLDGLRLRPASDVQRDLWPQGHPGRPEGTGRACRTAQADGLRSHAGLQVLRLFLVRHAFWSAPSGPFPPSPVLRAIRHVTGQLVMSASSVSSHAASRPQTLATPIMATGQNKK